MIGKTGETICYAIFAPSEDMIIKVAPWWLTGMAATFIIIVIMIKNKAAKYSIPVCVTLAVAIIVFGTIPNGYYFSEQIYNLICWAASCWYLFDIIYVLRYFITIRGRFLD